MNCTRRSFLKGSLATIFFSNFNVPLYGSIKNPKKKNEEIKERGQIYHTFVNTPPPFRVWDFALFGRGRLFLPFFCYRFTKEIHILKNEIPGLRPPQENKVAGLGTLPAFSTDRFFDR